MGINVENNAPVQINFIWVNRFDFKAAELGTTSSFISEYPAQHLNIAGRGYTARSIGAQATLNIELPKAVTVNTQGIVLVGDFTESATWRVTAYEQPAQSGTVIFDSDMQTIRGGYPADINAWSGQPQPFFYLPLSAEPILTMRSLTIEVEDAHNPYGYLALYRLLLGKIFTAHRAYIWTGYKLNHKPYTEVKTDSQGLRQFKPYPAQRELPITHPYLYLRELEVLANAYQLVGKQHDIFANFWLESADSLQYMQHSGLYRVASDLNFSPKPPFYYQASFSLVDSMGQN